MVLRDLECRSPVTRKQNRILVRLEHISFPRVAERLLVLDEENRLGSGQQALVVRLRAERHRVLGHLREVETEARAQARLTFDVDVTAALFDDAVDGRKAEAGARTLLLGGEERLKDPAHRRRIHSLAGVGHREHDVVGRAPRLAGRGASSR